MIYNFGSINIDHVYRVPHLPVPGETLSAFKRERYLGGKGANQSIAISKAGGQVTHIGAVGQDGDWALDQVSRMGVATDRIAQLEETTGHAVINVDDKAENSIVIFGGANRLLTHAQLSEALMNATSDDWVLFQNETNLVPEIVAYAKQVGCRVVYSAAPFVADTTLSLLDKVDLLVVNEVEAEALAFELGVETESIPVPQLLVTMGRHGARMKDATGTYVQKAFSVDAMDTTGAGDTFLGSFLARIDLNESIGSALRYAAAASALQVTKPGAATAIPDETQVLGFLNSMSDG